MAFVSNGQVVLKSTVLTSPSLFPRTYMPPMSGGSATWSATAYGELYTRQLWVYVLVNKLAGAACRLPLVTYERDELNRPRRDDHPMAQLLGRPNPGMSGLDLWSWTSATRDIFGMAVWYKRRVGGRVVGLYPLHPSGLSRGDGGRWSFANGSLRLDDIPAEDLVIFKTYNPTDMTLGLSPLEPLRVTLENEWAARTATTSFWQRGARPGTVLMHEHNLSETAIGRLRAQFDAIHAGADRTGGTLVLEEGMKAEAISLSAEEAQYIETRRLNREEVCAAYDVPPPVVHILDRATFSNITEQMRSMYRDTMGPRLKGFEATVDTQLRAQEWPDDPVYAEFLMDEVLRGDFEARQDALAKAAHMTIAEKRRMENLPFIEGTDRIFLNTATQPLDAIDAAAAQAPVSRGLTPGDARTVLGRLGWQATAADVDVDAVTRGLPGGACASVCDVLQATPPATPIATVRSAIKATVEGGTL